MENQIVECHHCGYVNIIEFDKQSEETSVRCHGCKTILEYDIEPIIEYKLTPKEFNYTHCINCGHQVLKSLVRKRVARGEILDKFCTGCYNKMILESNKM